jgi:hypothetical protein
MHARQNRAGRETASISRGQGFNLRPYYQVLFMYKRLAVSEVNLQPSRFGIDYLRT